MDMPDAEFENLIAPVFAASLIGQASQPKSQTKKTRKKGKRKTSKPKKTYEKNSEGEVTEYNPIKSPIIEAGFYNW